MSNYTECPHCGKRIYKTFESTQPLDGGPRRQSALAEPVNLLTTTGIAFACSLALCWWNEWPMTVPPLAGIVVGVGLPLLKVVLLYAPKAEEARVSEEVIKVQMTTPLPSGNRFQVDETFDVPAYALTHIAKRVVGDGAPFSRRQVCKGGKCSQTQFEKVQQVMVSRFWAEHDPANPQAGVRVNRHGMAVLRAIYSQKIGVVGGGGWLTGNRPTPNQVAAGQGRGGGHPVTGVL